MHWKIFLCHPDYSTYNSVEIHSKGGYKICICLVILGELEAFQNYKDFSFIFPNILESIALNVLRKWEFFFFLFPSNFWIQKF